jgi:hypothetical protein
VVAIVLWELPQLPGRAHCRPGVSKAAPASLASSAAVAFPRKLLFLAYIAIGVAVAASKNYLDNLDTAKRLGSAILAILLWPLLYLGIDLHID